jgi:DtxR family Mn-dependent transcriptional regulator
MKYTTSVEDYLKTIYLLDREKGFVRVSYISCILNIKDPSVTQDLAKLSNKGLIKHQKYRDVELTPKGEIIARNINLRHETLCRFLEGILNVAPEIAEKDACGMEHALSPDSLRKLAIFTEFMSNCPLGTPECLKGFRYYIEQV